MLTAQFQYYVGLRDPEGFCHVTNYTSSTTAQYWSWCQLVLLPASICCASTGLANSPAAHELGVDTPDDTATAGDVFTAHGSLIVKITCHFSQT